MTAMSTNVTLVGSSLGVG